MSKLEEMLKYVSEHNEFYKNRIKEYGIKDPLDINQWPILTRKELQENRYNMFSDGYKSKYFSQQLRRQFSSGSSGVPITVYWDYRDYSASIISLWRKRKAFYDITSIDKVVKFTMFDVSSTLPDTAKLEYYYESQAILNVNRLSLNSAEKFKQLFQLFEEFSPKWIYIQPSILEKVMYYYKYFEMSFPNSVQYIECVGEVLSNNLKTVANSFFSVPIVNMYGSEEMNGIAYECTDGCMHIIDNNVFVEVKAENGIHNLGKGEALITNLNNFAMPLIRYNQEDIINISDPHADCVHIDNSKIVNIIYGRKQERFYVGTQEINSLLLTSIISEVNNINFNMILDYSFEYTISSNTLQCFINVDEKDRLWLNEIQSQIKRCFYSHIRKDIKINFEIVVFKVNQSKLKRDILTIRER